MYDILCQTGAGKEREWGKKMSLGRTVKQLRNARKLSVRDLAAKAGVSKTTVNEIETGKELNPTRGTLTGIAAALSVPVGLLLQEDEAMKEIAGELMKKAQFGGGLDDLAYDQKAGMVKDILIQEPQAFYEAISKENYVGPLTDDEAVAVKAYLKIYRESKRR